jgi:hypothetical protein
VVSYGMLQQATGMATIFIYFLNGYPADDLSLYKVAKYK